MCVCICMCVCVCIVCHIDSGNTGQEEAELCMWLSSCFTLPYLLVSFLNESHVAESVDFFLFFDRSAHRL